nr:immunoglobulin heavy chain junction region [Macaca mulatta]MOW75627.1 immunoglobulin heavy chain junction region [Macaca mulatta]MOW75653.1 immunoglobulin heavy chain junction region [Macaca mulatta]MOW75684.1 immunoglobulin heavy chain junction region [Macaca mulatta]MOW76043.1 immunoglobulin heavy chain junction region [Macaca mulatta]
CALGGRVELDYW